MADLTGEGKIIPPATPHSSDGTAANIDSTELSPTLFEASPEWLQGQKEGRLHFQQGEMASLDNTEMHIGEHLPKTNLGVKIW